MEIDKKHLPDYIFEASWEVCNKVGGIYTVLSTKVKSLQKIHKDRVIMIGPDVLGKKNPWFIEESDLYKDWQNHIKINLDIKVRVGRWDVPGTPIVFLIEFEKLFEKKNDVYTQMWLDYGVDSLSAYGDYDECCMFAYGCGVVIESFYRYHYLEADHVIAHFNEWQLGMGVLYLKKYVPKIATVFTTHATTLGRSIAGNGMHLYDNLKVYNADRMAKDLNIYAKHSIEQKAALNADCFTTVSDITAHECTNFLHRTPFVTPNGFEKNFIPKGASYNKKRERARDKFFNVAEKMLGYSLQSDALIIGISGRYEFKNKGIDLFIDAMNYLNKMKPLSKDIVAFIMIPAWIKGPRKSLIKAIYKGIELTRNDIEENRYSTHELHEPDSDRIISYLRYLGINNNCNNRVKVIFVPSYLNGDDGIFNLSYYDLLIGLDVSVFPSYYEPWGYTPHESIAFSIPTITTTLAGFGVWAKEIGDKIEGLDDGIEVIYRDDITYHEVAKEISALIYDYTLKSDEQKKILRQCAADLSDQGDWKHFIIYYREAYKIALHNSFVRLSRQINI